MNVLLEIMSLPYFVYRLWHKCKFMLASTAFNHGKWQGCTKVNPPRFKYFASGGRESFAEVGLFNDGRWSSCCWTCVSALFCFSFFFVLSMQDFRAQPDMRYKAVSSACSSGTLGATSGCSMLADIWD